ncbi:SMP-30/gluconolactonase/LRE family protein, partial [uncultured Pseudomonas sp.]
MTAELILDARNATGESPVWSIAEQALYWVDIPAKRLHRWSPADGKEHSWQASQMLACIAQTGHGSWIAAMENGLFAITPHADGSLDSRLLASVTHALPGMRFNDGRCDRQGRFWAGTMVMDMAAGAP